MPDLIFENHGSLFLARPITDAGIDWLRDTSPDDAQFFGPAMVVEPRYAALVAKMAREDGLVVS